MSSIRETRRDAVWDHLVSHPEGATINQMMEALGYQDNEVRGAIFDLRHFLGDFDSINVPCDPAGHREQWIYRIVGTLDEVRGWSANRVRDAETRVRTMQAMLSSIVRATSGRTTEGRKARMMETALRHLVENLDNLAADSAA
jgi:hypothetical protein